MYTTQARVEAYLDRELSDNEATYIDDVIEYVSNFINSYTGRSWSNIVEDEEDEEEIEATERVFDGSGSRELFVDDFVEVEKIELLDATGSVYLTLEEGTDWQTFPSNNNPKQSIRLYANRFLNGYGNVRITAVWGAGSPPKSVIVVATALAAKFLLKSKSSTSQFKKESIEGYSYELQSSADHDAEVRSMLDTLSINRRIML